MEAGDKERKLLACLDKMQAQIDALGSDELKKQAGAIQGEVSQLRGGAKQAYREKINVLSSEVRDDNPYSRLMALKSMGIVKNYEDIRGYSIIVVGMGGIGSVAAEMLTRCGIGKLLLFDYDKVEVANMNRLFFRPDQAGMTKTDAAMETLKDINPDVEFESFCHDITTTTNFEHLLDRIQNGGKGGGPVDLVLSCVDNFAARMSINAACNELSVVWMESGVSEDAMSGHIQWLIPGKLACFRCLPPLVTTSGFDEKSLKRANVCAASLPTTMGVVAGLLVQNALKYLLDFGEVAEYLGYNAMKNFFPLYGLHPNPQCEDSWCCTNQGRFQAWKSAGSAALEPVKGWASKVEEVVVEDTTPQENEWGITLEDDSEPSSSSAPAPAAAPTGQSNLPEGVSFAYQVQSDAGNADDNVKVAEGADVDDLQAMLKSLHSK